MAKMTLLEIVQDILNDTDGDEVNSIEDTIESVQVANIVRSTFRSMMTNKDWPHTKKLTQLVASGTVTKPTYMTLPSGTKEVVSIYYDTKKVGVTRNDFTLMKWKENDEFLHILNQRNNDATNIDVITDTSGVSLNIQNDKAPQWYTSFDDETIVFDSYDSEVDSTLQSAKTQVVAFVIPDFTLSDTAVPDLPEEAFPYLVEEAKNRSSIKLRQMQDPAAALESRRQSSRMSRKDWSVNGGIRYPDYGRK